MDADEERWLTVCRCGRMRAYLRSLNPQLPRDVWILQAGGLANMFGNGVIGPFLIIYLHNVRGISLGVAGLIVASSSAAALCSGFVGGALADRLGPRAVLSGAGPRHRLPRRLDRPLQGRGRPPRRRQRAVRGSRRLRPARRGL